MRKCGGSTWAKSSVSRIEVVFNQLSVRVRLTFQTGFGSDSLYTAKLFL